MNLVEIARRVRLLKEAVEGLSKKTVDYRDIKKKLCLIESLIWEDEEESGDSITNTPIPKADDGNYDSRVIDALRNIEKITNYGLTLVYPPGYSNTTLRFSIDPNVEIFGSKRNKNDRKELTRKVINSLLTNKQTFAKYQFESQIEDTSKIYIRPVERGMITLSGAKVQNKFSSAGGFEMAIPAKDSNSFQWDISYIIDFEVKGSSRAESAINTKLREVTPCLVYELSKDDKLSVSLNDIISDPESTFESVRKAILNINQGYIEYINDKKNNGQPDSVLPGCRPSILKNCYDFDPKSYPFRMEAYVDGIKTLRYALNQAKSQHRKIDYFKYTGLTTMGSGSKGGTEDIAIVFKPEKEGADSQQLNISLKSGSYKSREYTFISFLESIGQDETKKFVDKVTTLGGKLKSKGGNLAVQYFSLLKSVRHDVLGKALKNMLYPGFSDSFDPENPSLLVWNVKDKNVDITKHYLDINDFDSAVLRKGGGSKIYNIIFYNSQDKSKLNFNDLNELKKQNVNINFRIRWYKRKGDNVLGNYKLIAEPRPGAFK